MKKVMDGNTAVSLVAYKFSDIASIYPITPSSPMASNTDALKVKGVKNLFNSPVEVIEMQSEAGAAGCMHGALMAGNLATTFTASQGLLLMIPNMYKIAGEELPAVMHVASRTIATHALSIFGDHSDIYACRQTGWCMIASSSVQSAHDLAAVTHLSAIRSSLPFMHFMDGFRTSHELNTVNVFDDKDLESLLDKESVLNFRNKSLNINRPVSHGMNENEDVYFQSIEARNKDYERIPSIVEFYMDKINEIQKTDYKPFNYYGTENAKYVIVSMGSISETIKSVVEDLNSNGHSVGMIEVHLYRPFSKDYLLKVLPSSVRRIAVLDRTKEAGSVGEPLYLDVVASLKDTNIDICGGRYGLSSKNTTPSDIYAVFDMLESEIKYEFTIGIEDDVTNLSLPKNDYVLSSTAKEIVIYGYGSDGMVSASKDLLKVIGETQGDYVQGYFQYDSKKSGGVTVSNLRFDSKKIEAPYYNVHPNIMVVTKDVYLSKFRVTENINKNGVIIINTEKDFSKLDILKSVKEDIKSKNITVFTIDAEEIAKRNKLSGKISMIFEAILLKLLGVNNYLEILTKNIEEKFKTKGENIVRSNIQCVKEAIAGLVPFKDELVSSGFDEENDDTFNMIEKRKGDLLPVSALLDYRCGEFEAGTSKLEKRGITNIVPNWKSENCIQCGMCSMVCPHAVIRPFVVENDREFASNGVALIGDNDGKYKYIISVSEADCTGCGACARVCPGKGGEKALIMGPTDIKRQRLANTLFNFYKNPNVQDKFTIKGSQLERPKFEFSGACAGCGETTYLKLLTQLYGDRLIIANATGCSSIYGGAVPSTPYSIPWANSLFEDNAEFGFGIYNGYRVIRNRIKHIMQSSMDSVSEVVQELFTTWIDNMDDYEVTKKVKKELKGEDIPREIIDLKDYLEAPSVWSIGGDGWAYDIGFGGIDHILSSGENVNILVLDTEVYSNTGGQASKSSRVGQVAEFADNGKKTNKKDLFRIAMSYPNCYVASVSMGANMFQTIKAFKEAEEHKGPSIIIAYAPCIEQGIKKGMACAQEEQKLSVECGYTLLMRYNGEKLTIDSKEPNYEKYEEFLDGEVRYNSLRIKNPDLANVLLTINKENAIDRYNYYKNLVTNDKNVSNTD